MSEDRASVAVGRAARADAARADAAGAVGGRRRLLGHAVVLGLAGTGLAGCGFRPLHGSAAGGIGDPALAAELASIRVVPMAERFGQLMQRDLEQRLAMGRRGVAPRYQLAVAPSFGFELLGYLIDGSATRVRFTGTANWTLDRLAPIERLASGFERTLDAYNIEGAELFAADMSQQAMLRRISAALSELVVMRVAVQMQRLRSGASAQQVAPVPDMGAMPLPSAVPGPQLLPGGLPPGMEGAPLGGLGGGIGAPGLR